MLAQRDETGELTISLTTYIVSGNYLKILLLENQDEIIRLNESRVKSEVFTKSLRPHDKESDTYSTEGFNFLNNT